MTENLLITQDALLDGVGDPNKLLATNLMLSTAAGVLDDNKDGTWTFTPDANFNGEVEFIFTTSVKHTLTLNVSEI